MKYWRGYLTAGIFLACNWALETFAKGHIALMDTIYPYITRMMQDFLAGWSGGVDFCVWQVLLLALAAVAIGTLVLVVVFKWNPVQWFGWVCAVVALVMFLNTALFGLNQYAGSLAEDIRLEETDYTITELEKAAAYYRDQANRVSDLLKRDKKGNADARDVDAHLHPKLALDLLPVGLRDEMEHHAFLRAVQTEIVQNVAGGRAAAQGDDADGEGHLLIEIDELVGQLSGGDGDHHG